MAITRQQSFLSQAAMTLGIHYKLNHEVRLPNEQTIIAPTFISNFGGVIGNLVFVQMPNSHIAQQLIGIGYGITAYSLPSEKENFDLATYIEMFEEWGWTGPAELNPLK